MSDIQLPKPKVSNPNSSKKKTPSKGLNQNILDLILLSTGDLKQKFAQERQKSASITRQMKIRAGNKFPLDFFQQK